MGFSKGNGLKLNSKGRELPRSEGGKRGMINIKTQTKRATKWHPRITNMNLFCNGFQFGIVTSQSWGDFQERSEPLVTFTLEEPGRSQIDYQMPMSKFIAKLKAMVS